MVCSVRLTDINREVYELIVASDCPYLEEVFNRLSSELPTERQYHSVFHTRDEVLPAARQLAGIIGIDGSRSDLLLAAAAFHDMGYMNGPDAGHEERSIKIAEQTLPAYGYTPQQMATIASIIRSTIWPQQPRNLVEQIMADADLAPLGAPWETFLARSRNLWAEIEAVDGEPISEEAWYQGQIEFLSAHSYFTQAAAALWDGHKAQNIANLQAELEARKASNRSG